MRELYDKMFESAKDYENPEIIDAILNLAADALLTQQTTLKRQEVLKKLMDLAEEISVS